MLPPCVCGQINHSEARFCGTCGRPIAAIQPLAGRLSVGASFVGRSRELGLLRSGLDDAVAGRGGLTLLVGEAGIGKTQIARAFADEARERGAIVLWGSSFEGDWSPSYGPWVDALSELVGTIEPERLRQFLGHTASSVSRLVPALELSPANLPTTMPLEPDEERFRLFDAVGKLLITIGSEKPVVLILDDLHWADPDSLQLLRFVARLTGMGRLLVVGSYRDPTGDPAGSDKLADVLAIVRRESDYRRIVVGGLTAAEVADYLAALAGQELPQALLHAIHSAAAGNPFYVQEIFRHLVEEEKIFHRAGRWSTDISPRELGIPDGVRHVVARRTSRLSPATARLLSVVAALTGGFEFRLLPPLLGLSEETLLDSLDEALRAGLIRTVSGATAQYEFAHAIVRHTVYGELNPDRRARLHRRIALALEQVYAGREQVPAGELAFQYHASASVGGGERGIAFCLLAADDARASYAFEQVVTFLRMARDLATDVSARAPLLQRLATAEADALMLAESRQTADDALAAMKEAGVDAREQAKFLSVVGRALREGGANPDFWQPLVERGLTLVGSARDLTWARLDLLIDRYESERIGEVTIDRWRGYDPEAVAILRTDGDEDDHARTLEPRVWHTRADSDAILNLARGWTSPSAIMRALGVVANDLMTRHGAFREAAERFGELLATAEKCGAVSGQAEALVQLALVQADLGNFDLAREYATRARQLLSRLGAGHRLQTWAPWLSFNLAFYLDGDWEPIASDAVALGGDAIPRGTALSLLWHGFVAVAHARAGKTAAGDRLLAALVPALDRLEPRTYGFGASLALGVEAAWTLGLTRYATTLRRLALDAIAAGVGDPPLGSHPLSVARSSAMMGDPAVARDYFARARTSLASGGRRPLQTIVDADEAQMLLGANPIDRQRVGALLDVAVAEFNRLGMSGWEQRTRDARERLIATPAHSQITASLANPDGLTPRELEVLRLIAAGHSTREIAADLVVSVATVERHIGNLYGKIGARGRADATTYAWRNGLTPTP